jgi:nitrate reductase gamma subunit
VKKRKSPATILFLLTTTVLSVLFLNFPVEASWFINPKKFHASVHGQMSCQDCHENILQRKMHPDPEEITKKQMDFFKVDDCLMCHEEVMDNLEKGMHGTLKVEKPKAYSKCLHCHDPHTETAVGEAKGSFSRSTPLYEQCGACHEEQTTLPSLSKGDEACMACHRTEGPGDEMRIRAVCFYCHARERTPVQKMTGEKVSLIRPGDYDSTSHADIGCMECHPQAGRFNHNKQEPAACTQCHVRHDEKVTHDLHSLVTCGACHLGGVMPARDVRTKQIVWKIAYPPVAPSRIHHMVTQGGEKTCERCHVKGNGVGAATMILPSKSVICMPCHAATLSVGDKTTIASILIFLGGLVSMFAYVLTGAPSGARETGSPRKSLIKPLPLILKAILLDVLLQRRLYLQSGRRWLIHGLIFYPFIFRFSWGLLALIGSLWNPRWSWVWVMLDENRALTGFLFDLAGIMLIVGIVLALVRGARKRQAQAADFSGQDRPALLLIGAIVVVGFVLEGMQIAMTRYPPGSSWCFVGYVIGSFCAGLSLTGVYGYIWYLHAILTGAFIAYIPFSRLAHIIIAPVVLALNAIGKH